MIITSMHSSSLASIFKTSLNFSSNSLFIKGLSKNVLIISINWKEKHEKKNLISFEILKMKKINVGLN